MPWRYWLTVVLVSVVGTQITDAPDGGLEVSLYLSTSVFAVALAATFAVWYSVERTLSIHTIVTRRRELFYWAAILFTFALGTAAGDLATEALQLGFRLGVVVFGALHRARHPRLLSRGQSGPDLLDRLCADPAARRLARRPAVPGANLRGLGLGTIVTSAVFLTVIVVLVAFLSLGANGPRERAGNRRERVKPPPAIVRTQVTTLGNRSYKMSTSEDWFRRLRCVRTVRRRRVGTAPLPPSVRIIASAEAAPHPSSATFPRSAPSSSTRRPWSTRATCRREGPDQGSRDILGRCGTLAEAARAGGVARRRQGDRSRAGGAARQQAGSRGLQASAGRSSRDHGPRRRQS